MEFPIDGLDLSRIVTSDSTSSLSLIPSHSSPGNDLKRLNKTWDNALPERGLNSEASNDEDLIYDLVAVCNHRGDLSNGHYTGGGFSELNYWMLQKKLTFPAFVIFNLFLLAIVKLTLKLTAKIHWIKPGTISTTTKLKNCHWTGLWPTLPTCSSIGGEAIEVNPEWI